jgi:capsular polysaccharide biosynthesis protein
VRVASRAMALGIEHDEEGRSALPVELRHYGTMLLRRLWIIVLVVGVVLLYVAYQYTTLAKTPGALTAYQSNISLQVGLQATAHSSDQFYADYQSVAEAQADELVSGPVLTSPEFIRQVLSQIQADTDEIAQRYGPNANLGNLNDPTAIANALTASRTHTLVTLSITWSTPAGAWAIANAIGEVCYSQLSNYLDYEIRTTPSSASTQPLVGVKVISAASQPARVAGPAAHKVSMLLILLLVALLLGLALAALIEYLDDRIFDTREAMQLLQLPVYGEIPRNKK